ncbi:hypothetical protein BV20DRAFT_713102 [Pilatotrama ljubarskyi]|nr:hypothetical protein BV20DRAFT_713102 [Pilatotrama ljubarskyi]
MSQSSSPTIGRTWPSYEGTSCKLKVWKGATCATVRILPGSLCGLGPTAHGLAKSQCTQSVSLHR